MPELSPFRESEREFRAYARARLPRKMYRAAVFAAALFIAIDIVLAAWLSVRLLWG